MIEINELDYDLRVKVKTLQNTLGTIQTPKNGAITFENLIRSSDENSEYLSLALQILANEQEEYAYKLAIHLCQQSMDGPDVDANTFLHTAAFYEAIGNLTIAIQYLQDATDLNEIKNNPKLLIETYQRLIICAQRGGQYKTAITALKDLQKYRPLTGNELNDWGAMLFKIGDIDEAYKTLERSILLAPQNPAPQITLSEIFIMRKRFSPAQKCLERAENLLNNPKSNLDDDAKTMFQSALAETRQQYDAQLPAESSPS